MLCRIYFGSTECEIRCGLSRVRVTGSCHFPGASREDVSHEPPNGGLRSYYNRRTQSASSSESLVLLPLWKSRSKHPPCRLNSSLKNPPCLRNSSLTNPPMPSEFQDATRGKVRIFSGITQCKTKPFSFLVPLRTKNICTNSGF